MKNWCINTRVTAMMVAMILVFAAEEGKACTSAIITGKATVDGKPLIWKHRDTGTEQNRMVYSNEGKYPFIGLVNSHDTDNREVWAGTNSVGFSILNTASYNIQDKDDTTRVMDHEGIIMRMALERCATLSDFEHFLDTLPRPLRVEANFAVIDALGGAAYYETNNYRYVKADANDPLLAPHGYLLRTNFSYAGFADEGMGYIRHETAVRLFSEQRATGKFSPEWIYGSADRSYYHSMLGTDLREIDFEASGATGYVVDQDYIPRFSTSASVVIQGVRAGEPAEHTTLWTALGFPSCSVAFPLWVKGGEQLPSLLTRGDDSENAPLCEKVVALKYTVFPVQRGNGRKYFQWNALYNVRNTGIMQLLAPVEKEIFEKTHAARERWGTGDWNRNDIQALYQELNQLVTDAYQDLFTL